MSNNGTQFSVREWSKTLTEIGIKCKFISVYCSEGNQTERYNKEIGRVLRSYCHNKHTRWPNMFEFGKR